LNLESMDLIWQCATISGMHNNEYCRNCERSVPKITFLIRIGKWSSKKKKATVYKFKLNAKNNIIQNVITIVKERGKEE